MITVKNLTKEFVDHDGTVNKVLNGINYEINKGEKIVIVGPSGSGKSTFLRCLNGLEDIKDGRIILEGETVDPSKSSIFKIRERIGMVFY